jgi:predicted RNase H-like nuclease (RuvC/YqgF family)
LKEKIAEQEEIIQSHHEDSRLHLAQNESRSHHHPIHQFTEENSRLNQEILKKDKEIRELKVFKEECSKLSDQLEGAVMEIKNQREKIGKLQTE